MDAPSQRNARLGRGLASLIGDAAPASSYRTGGVSGAEQRNVPLDRIRSSTLNPRKTFPQEELQELANSIREKGLIQPIVVRPVGLGGQDYEIVAGERRWRAAALAGLHSIAAIVRVLSDRDALELAIIENVQREGLNPIEEAAGYRELIERFGHTQEALGQIVGKSRSHLSNMMRLLGLPEPVQAMVRSGELSPSTARALVGRPDAEQAARDILKHGLSQKEAERNLRGDKPARTQARNLSQPSADIKAAEREMADALGLFVVLSPGAGEAGEVIIRYKTLEQFEAVKARLTRD